MTVARHVAVVGAGMIGRSWAIAFARGGYRVRMHDVDPSVTAASLAAMPPMLRALADLDLLHGRSPETVSDLIGEAATLAEAADGAIHVQENAPERPDVKRAIFAALDAASPPDAVIASSTSALLPSSFIAGLEGAGRCLVAHPLNPPHLIPAVELVPGPETRAETVERTRALMEEIGQSPIETVREVEGFVMNRLQGAILDEAFSLVAQGLATPTDIDTAMRDGLARRWVFMGPFETIDLNAPGGVGDFMDRYGTAYASIGAMRPNRPEWSGTLRARICAERAAALPANRRAGRMRWRDDRLAALARFLSKSSENPS